MMMIILLSHNPLSQNCRNKTLITEMHLELENYYTISTNKEYTTSFLEWRSTT